MEQDSRRIRLGSVAEQVGSLASETRWYLFGGAARGEPADNRDIDLLIVYDHRDVARARCLMAAIEEAETPQPLDVVMLNAREAAEMQFVEREGAICFWPSP